MEVSEPIRNRIGIYVGNVTNGNLYATKEDMLIFGAANQTALNQL